MYPKRLNGFKHFRFKAFKRHFDNLHLTTFSKIGSQTDGACVHVGLVSYPDALWTRHAILLRDEPSLDISFC